MCRIHYLSVGLLVLAAQCPAKALVQVADGELLRTDSHFNQSCQNSSSICFYYIDQTCDTETRRCVCMEGTVFDRYYRMCRPWYCFERCTEPGYECRDDVCQLCWAQDNRYLCNRPEEIYIPVTYSIIVTFVVTISVFLFAKLGCYCRQHYRAMRRTNRAQSAAQRSCSDPMNSQSELPILSQLHSSNPFAVYVQAANQQQTISTQVQVQHSMNINSCSSREQSGVEAPEQPPPAYATVSRSMAAAITEC